MLHLRDINARNTHTLRRVLTWGTAVLGASIVLSACASTSTTPSAKAPSAVPTHPLIGFLVPAETVGRYADWDIPNFEHSMSTIWPSAKVVAESSNGSASEQLAEAQALLTRGAKAIVMIPDSATESKPIVVDAHKDGVPVVEFSRLTKDAPVAALVGVNPVTVGEALATYMVDHTKAGDTIAIINGSPTASFAVLENQGEMKILKPYITAGTRKIVGNVFTRGWSESRADAEMTGLLTKYHDNIQGVICANDGMSYGVHAALAAAHMPSIPLTGIDGTAPGITAILKGQLSMTVWRNDKIEQHDDAVAVYDLLHHITLPKSIWTTTSYNGLRHVPWATFPIHVITKRNVSVEIDAGAVTTSEICKGVPAGVGPCT